jgi:hypothetical protein
LYSIFGWIYRDPSTDACVAIYDFFGGWGTFYVQGLP